jgi:outer membrane lipoprotein SlyB
MRPKALARYLVIVSALSLVGCRGSATSPDSAATSNGDAATTSGPNAAGTNAQKAPESSLANIIAPKPIVVGAGKEIVVTADQPVSSKTSNPGDSFEASIAEPVVVGEKVVIPKGAKATGTVTEAKSAGKFKGNAAITLTLSSVTVHGEEYRLKTTQVTESGKSRGKRTAVGAGGGAAVGAIIGALAGGGKGAAIGAGAGAGAGTAGAVFTGDKDITIRPETKLTFELKEPLEVKKK